MMKWLGKTRTLQTIRDWFSQIVEFLTRSTPHSHWIRSAPLHALGSEVEVPSLMPLFRRQVSIINHNIMMLHTVVNKIGHCDDPATVAGARPKPGTTSSKLGHNSDTSSCEESPE